MGLKPMRACAMVAALNVDGVIVMVHVHLYETTAGLAENAVGGTWHPDELRRFFEKIRKYRSLLLRNADLFFSRVQIPRALLCMALGVRGMRVRRVLTATPLCLRSQIGRAHTEQVLRSP